MKKEAKDVDTYIKAAPKEIQARLVQLRKIIRDTAPAVEERISYQMPFYSYKGQLAYFAFAKTHVGLYIPPPVIAEHKEELKEYTTSTATVRFPLNKRLPVTLIKKLIKAQMKRNDLKSKKS